MTFTVHSDRSGYPVIIEKDALNRAPEYLSPIARRWAVITDENVSALYGKALTDALRAAGLDAVLFPVPAGEGSKTLTVYEHLCAALNGAGFGRRDGVIALGGGMVGDLAGFTTATYRRGLPLVHIPTTLLSQVDSSIGGKTGLDTASGKNQVGVFYRPKAVVIDPDCLTTLPPRQIHSGMAEVIKCGMIADPAILNMAAEPKDWEALIARCLAVKKALVEQDEFDEGPRHLLNFGHTFGHAFEALGGYEEYTHGEAVAAGMAHVLRWQMDRGDDAAAAYGHLTALLERWDLPAFGPCDDADLARFLRSDKKSDGDTIEIVTLQEVGRAALRSVPVAELLEATL